MKIHEKTMSAFPPQQDAFQTKIHYLKRADIFCDLSLEELQDVARAATVATCPPGKIFYSPNERAEVMFVLKKGHVQLYRMSDEGRKLVMTTDYLKSLERLIRDLRAENAGRKSPGVKT